MIFFIFFIVFVEIIILFNLTLKSKINLLQAVNLFFILILILILLIFIFILNAFMLFIFFLLAFHWGLGFMIFACMVLLVWWPESRIWKVNGDWLSSSFFLLIFFFILVIRCFFFLKKNWLCGFIQFLLYQVILISWPNIRVLWVNLDWLAL